MAGRFYRPEHWIWLNHFRFTVCFFCFFGDSSEKHKIAWCWVLIAKELMTAKFSFLFRSQPDRVCCPMVGRRPAFSNNLSLSLSLSLSLYIPEKILIPSDILFISSTAPPGSRIIKCIKIMKKTPELNKTLKVPCGLLFLATSQTYSRMSPFTIPWTPVNEAGA